MKINKVQIKNYRQFVDSNEICFEKGITVLAGANNIGKTSLIELLSMVFNGNENRNRKKYQ